MGGARGDIDAVVLVSGGLDSATALAMAIKDGYRCHALTFDYGQRHRLELGAAERVVASLGVVEHRMVKLDLTWMGGSALTDPDIPVPEKTDSGIPVTYVPARNTIFLAIALGWAEVLKAEHIFIGVNAVDYSGYPDCRPDFIAAFEAMATVATRAGVDSKPLTIHTPLIQLSKAEIIHTGTRLGVDFSLTLSCYNPAASGQACGRCDSCRLRAEGFETAGIADPTRYQR